jgi:putative ABC transport system ATP-binding protein
MGASGSGKTTLLNMLGCLDKQTEGIYLLDGVDVGKLSRK